jgi:hypothetical protein
MAAPRRAFVAVFAVATVIVAGGALLVAAGSELADSVSRALLFGQPLLEIRSPAPGQDVAQGGVEIIVHFPLADRTASDTFRCLLNGRDVTPSLTRGENGAAGSVLGAVEGENHVRVEVFGRPWWGGPWLEDAREVRFRVRPLPTLDRA